MSGDVPRFATLLDMLAYRAAISGEKTAFTFEGSSTTYSMLWEHARKFGAFLQQGLPRGRCAVVALPNGPDFFSAFYGIQCAGGIAVPLFPASDTSRILRIAANCDAACVVLPEMQRTQMELTSASGIPFCSVAQSAASRPDNSFPAIAGEDLAFLQYTSGSTGEPKGVMLSHANLLKNAEQMIAGMEITSDDIFVSWLPAYHDMGLILMTIVPFYLGAITHLLPADLANVGGWLNAIETQRGTFTAAPDFAYRLCVRRVEGVVDLSSLRVALNAAEPVRAATIRDFERKFHLEHVMTAGYGLAEATVGVSMSPPGTPVRVDARGLVSVGRPFPEVEICIVEEDRFLPAGQIGEIAVRSAARCGGYYNSPAETEALFRLDGFLLSGDLGYLDEDGFLYIVGRKKNTIKLAGETLAPQEIEEIVDAAASIRFSAALGIDRGGSEGEQVVVLAELKGKPDVQRCEETVIDIVESIHGRLGFRPARVLLLRPHSIPRTYNGKIQHALLKEQYMSGQLREQGAIVFPEA